MLPPLLMLEHLFHLLLVDRSFLSVHIPLLQIVYFLLQISHEVLLSDLLSSLLSLKRNIHSVALHLCGELSPHLHSSDVAVQEVVPDGRRFRHVAEEVLLVLQLLLLSMLLPLNSFFVLLLEPCCHLH